MKENVVIEIMQQLKELQLEPEKSLFCQEINGNRELG